MNRVDNPRWLRRVLSAAEVLLLLTVLSQAEVVSARPNEKVPAAPLTSPENPEIWKGEIVTEGAHFMALPVQRYFELDATSQIFSPAPTA